MKLSSRARHAVRLALEIARHGGTEEPVGLNEISKVTGISRRFLEQLAAALKNHALIRGISGRNGGYVLARPADKITVGNVLNAVIGPLDLSICTLDENLCMSSEFCECRLVWLLLKQRVNESLDEYTLADMLNKNWADSIRHQLRATTHVEARRIGGSEKSRMDRQAVTFNGIEYKLDRHGFLDPPHQWDEDFAEGMAKQLGIHGGLTEADVDEQTKHEVTKRDAQGHRPPTEDK